MSAHLHHHLVVSDAVFQQSEDGGARRFDLAPPAREELERLLARIVRRTVKMVRARRLLEEVDLDDTTSRV